ncbi:MAG: hypothetical protein KGI33_01250 [Thaumarchaeota archaeon]|nr:hypothetical protein [Nitrososphaerota archaeon]
MTTKKAIEIIRKDIENYKKQTASLNESRNCLFEGFESDNTSPFRMRDTFYQLIKQMHDLLDSVYQGQIKQYEDILNELESKKK